MRVSAHAMHEGNINHVPGVAAGMRQTLWGRQSSEQAHSTCYRRFDAVGSAAAAAAHFVLRGGVRRVLRAAVLLQVIEAHCQNLLHEVALTVVDSMRRAPGSPYWCVSV